MARDVEIYIDPRLRAFLNSGPMRARALREVLDDMADHATAQQRIYAPVGETGYLHAHIARTGIKYFPGGYGGGGRYEVVSGVLRGTSRHPLYVHGGTGNPTDAQIEDAYWGDRGTPSSYPTQNRIYPRADRGAATAIATTNVQGIYGRIGPRARLRVGGTRGIDAPSGIRRPALTFQKKGEPRKFRPWVSGQRPQPFVYFAFVHTAVYAEGRLRAAVRQMF